MAATWSCPVQLQHIPGYRQPPGQTASKAELLSNQSTTLSNAGSHFVTPVQPHALMTQPASAEFDLRSGIAKLTQGHHVGARCNVGWPVVLHEHGWLGNFWLRLVVLAEVTLAKVMNLFVSVITAAGHPAWCTV